MEIREQENYNLEKLKNAPDAAFIIRTMISLNHQNSIIYLLRLTDEMTCTAPVITKQVQNWLIFAQQGYLFEAVKVLCEKTKDSYPGIEQLIEQDEILREARLSLIRQRQTPHAEHWKRLKIARNNFFFHYNSKDCASLLQNAFSIYMGNLIDDPEKEKVETVRDDDLRVKWHVMATEIEIDAIRSCITGGASSQEEKEKEEELYREWVGNTVKAYLRFGKTLVAKWLEQHQIITATG